MRRNQERRDRTESLNKAFALFETEPKKTEETMAYRRIASVMICLAVTLALSATALAGNPSVTTTDNGRVTIISGPTAAGTAYVPEKSKLRVLFSNVGYKYPKGLYFCCYGGTISGPNSIIGAEYWEAAGFVAPSDALVKRVVVGAGYVTGTFTDLIMTFNEDNGGVPGNELIHWQIGNLGTFGSCCIVGDRKDRDGVPIQAGKTYWVVLKTEHDSDIWAAWNFNSTDQIDPIPSAFAQDGVWQGYLGVPGFSFAVSGK